MVAAGGHFNNMASCCSALQQCNKMRVVSTVYPWLLLAWLTQLVHAATVYPDQSMFCSELKTTHQGLCYVWNVSNACPDGTAVFAPAYIVGQRISNSRSGPEGVVISVDSSPFGTIFTSTHSTLTCPRSSDCCAADASCALTTTAVVTADACVNPYAARCSNPLGEFCTGSILQVNPKSFKYIAPVAGVTKQLVGSVGRCLVASLGGFPNCPPTFSLKTQVPTPLPRLNDMYRNTDWDSVSQSIYPYYPENEQTLITTSFEVTVQTPCQFCVARSCKSISRTDPTVCLVCLDGYRLVDDGSCQPPPVLTVSMQRLGSTSAVSFPQPAMVKLNLSIDTMETTIMLSAIAAVHPAAIAATNYSAIYPAIIATTSTTSSESSVILSRTPASQGSLSLATTISIARPSSTVLNDVMIATISARKVDTIGDTTVISYPGWTRVYFGNNTCGTSKLATHSLTVFQKIYSNTGSDLSTQYTFTVSTAAIITAIINSFSGVDLVTPVDSMSTPTILSTVQSIFNTGPITTIQANSMLVASFDNCNADVWSTPTSMAPSGYIGIYSCVSLIGLHSRHYSRFFNYIIDSKYVRSVVLSKTFSK